MQCAPERVLLTEREDIAAKKVSYQNSGFMKKIFVSGI